MPPVVNSGKNSSLTHESIVRDVRAGKISPVYYLMGEEGYYIDRIANFIIESLLKPEERDFNLITLFGAETDIDTVINAAKGFPMGAQYLVVVVKEAQNLEQLDRFEYYLKQVQPSTVLLFCHKNGVLDRRKKIVGLIEKVGTVYDSKKLKDDQLPAFMQEYLRRKGYSIEPLAVAMMVESVGADLNRMVGELEKLCLSLTVAGKKTINAELVEHNVGISKEFNNFELQDALIKKDVLRANRIIRYFEKNPKLNPIQKVLPFLFRFFSNLMLAHYAPEKTEKGIAAWLGISDWQVKKNVIPAMPNYSAMKVMKIIGEIRRTDARSKGVGNPSISDGELMKELLFFILH